MMTVAFMLLQGCSFTMPYSTDHAAVYDDATYNEKHDSEVSQTATVKHEDEVPVQMTKHDSDLDAVAPVAKNPSKTNQDKNVLLPISSGDLE